MDNNIRYILYVRVHNNINISKVFTKLIVYHTFNIIIIYNLSYSLNFGCISLNHALIKLKESHDIILHYFYK